MGRQAMMFCECLSKNEKFPEMNSVNMSEPDRISRCVYLR